MDFKPTGAVLIEDKGREFVPQGATLQAPTDELQAIEDFGQRIRLTQNENLMIALDMAPITGTLPVGLLEMQAQDEVFREAIAQGYNATIYGELVGDDPEDVFDYTGEVNERLFGKIKHSAALTALREQARGAQKILTNKLTGFNIVDVLARIPFSPFYEYEMKYYDTIKGKEETGEYRVSSAIGLGMWLYDKLGLLDISQAEREAYIEDYQDMIRARAERGILIDIVDGISMLPAYMTEFWIGGKAAAALGLPAKGVMGVLGAAGTRTLITPERFTAALIRQKAVPDQGPVTSFLKAYGDVYISNLAEAGGEWGPQLLRKMPLGSKILDGLIDIGRKLHIPESEVLRRIGTKLGYNGLLAEWGEERLETIMKGLFDIEDFGTGPDSGIIPRMTAGLMADMTLRNQITELGVLSAPFATRMMLAKIISDKPVEIERLKTAEETKAEEEAPTTPEAEMKAPEGVQAVSEEEMAQIRARIAERRAKKEVQPAGGEVEAYRYGENKEGVQFWSKNKDYAEEYAEEKGGRADDVRQGKITLTNPLVVEMSAKEFADPTAEKKWIDKAKQEGNDGVIFRHGEDEFYAQIIPTVVEAKQPALAPPAEQPAGGEVAKQAEPAKGKGQAPAPQARKAEGKQPWEMTREEWLNPTEEELGRLPSDESRRRRMQPAGHKMVIKQAVSEGKPVPRAVLEEYKGEKWADEALAKMTGKLPGGREAGGTILFDPEEWRDMLRTAQYYLGRGVDNLADLTEAVVKEFGEDVRPFVEQLWNEFQAPKKMPEEAVAEPKAKRKKTKRARRIEKVLKEDFGESVMYKGMSMENQAIRADSLIDEDRDRVWRILNGQEDAPAGLKKASLYRAMELVAMEEGDSEALRSLAVGPASFIFTEMGQEIKALDRPVGTDPVKAMQEVEKAREAGYTKKTKEKSSKKAKAQHVKEIKAEIKKQAKVSKWETFIRELQC